MRRRLPLHGILGLFFLFLSQILLFKKVEPFYSWFFCFAWWSYIFMMDGVIYFLKGNSLILSRRKEFLLMIPWSVFIWLIFEAANLSLQNWYYINLPNSALERWPGYAVAYGTVLPGIFETTEFLRTVGLSKRSAVKKMWLPEEIHGVLVLLGSVCLFSSVVFPKYFFPLIWGGFIFLLEPLNYRMGGRSLLRDLEHGKPGKIYRLLVAGLICGLLWEFWNFWAPSKWIYTVPFFDDTKGFEMPVLGFLGFPPFAVEVYVMYNFISLFRFGRGWEESNFRLHPERKLRPASKIVVGFLMILFCILVFRAIDLRTVDSYEVRLQDAFWIDPQFRKELPRVGISTLDDLLEKTEGRKDRSELALRLLISKEQLNEWVEKGRLARLKGLGIENLALLERLGIQSVHAMAAEDPEQLYQRIKEFCQVSAPKKAKISIWIKEARKARRSD